MAQVTFNVLIHEEDGSYWSEVKELPGCFASGFSMDELREATFEAIQMWLPDGIELGDPKWSPVKPKKPAPRGKKRPPQRVLICA